MVVLNFSQAEMRSLCSLADVNGLSEIDSWFFAGLRLSWLHDSGSDAGSGIIVRCGSVAVGIKILYQVLNFQRSF